MSTTTTRTVIARPRFHRRTAGPAPTLQGPSGKEHRSRNAVAAAGVLLALGGAGGLWWGLSDGNDTPSAPADVPFRSTLPQGIDGSDARLHNRARELEALRESAEGSDRRLYQLPNGPGRL